MKLFFLLLLFSSSLFAQNPTPPNGYTELARVKGDLTKDGIAELVVVYNTPDTSDFGTFREIQVFKNDDKKWILWKKSRSAIMKSEEGGMMGEPFQGIEIINGILTVQHSGGSSWKWSNTDKYRFQNNEFELIGYTTIYGKVCEYWTSFDFNLSTGKAIYKKDIEHCNDDGEPTDTGTIEETFYKKGIKLNLSNRYLTEIKFKTPKHKADIYL